MVKIAWVLVLLWWGLFAGLPQAAVGRERRDILEKVTAIPVRAEWDRFKILVWQFKTSALEDISLYRQVGLNGFHIDRVSRVQISVRELGPFMVPGAGKITSS